MRALVTWLLLVPAVAVAQTPAGPPAVPSFDITVPGDGTHGVRELRSVGKPHLDTELQVSGYITWIYDCIADVKKPKEARAKTQKRIDEDPTLCEKPRFLLGDTKKAAEENTLWVVGVPRPPNKLEKARLPRAELESWPAVPKLAVGDFVTVTGTFAYSSPSGERNSDGLVVWKSFKKAKPGTPKTLASATVTLPSPLPTKVPAAKAIDAKLKQASEAALAKGLEHYGKRDHAAAIKMLNEALKLWPGNDRAWATLAGAYMWQAKHKQAAEAGSKAFALRPDLASNAEIYGIALYELERNTARQPNHDKALQLLVTATSLDAKDARAHYFIGRIHRDRGEHRGAAEAFTKAVATSTTDPSPYIALAELYRSWAHLDLAQQVADLGIAAVGPPNNHDLHYISGMIADTRRNDDDAVAAFTAALRANPKSAKAKFQRGQVYVRQKKTKEATADLQEFLQEAGPEHELAKQQASLLLMDLER